jgi:hypothetical protein
MGLSRIFSSAAVILAFSGCAPRNETAISPETLYMARAAFCWENLNHFQIRGRAKAVGESLVAEGPMVVWGNRFPPRLRGDVYGPDGRPLVSFFCDSTGFLCYYPGEEAAFFHAGGLHAGSGSLTAISLLALLRTGFPVPPEQRVLAETMTEGGWLFTASGDTARLDFGGGLFPSRLAVGGSEAMITQTSWHDEYRAWPSAWLVVTSYGTTEFTITAINEDTPPWDAVWLLRVPVPIDSLDPLPPWELTPEPLIR